jgi:hypothetical protein
MIYPGAERRAVMSPGDLTDPNFMSIEALVEWIDTGEETQPQFAKLQVLMQLEEGDLEQLVMNDGKFWYVTLGAPMRPFSMVPVGGEGRSGEE